MRKPLLVRMKVTATMCDNISYIVVDNHHVTYCSASEIPLSLSNIADGNAAELRFALEDAATPNEAVAVARRLCKFAKKVELI